MDRSLNSSGARGYKWTSQEILTAVHGNLLSGNVHQEFDGINIDSRAIHQNDCFLAIKGEVHDGHTFVPGVIEQGVRGIVIQKGSLSGPIQDTSVVCIEVDDTLAALGALANYQRRRSKASVVAITGSNGKTSTRSMTAAVLSNRFHVLYPEGNFNNEVGLPLTLLKLTPIHEWAILELGMNHAGEIRRLANICLPDIGMITNIGPAHLEGLGSIEGVMHAKGELLEKIGPNGKIILNADDPMTGQLAGKTTLKPILFGASAEADVRGSDITADLSGISFTLQVMKETIRVSLPTPGKFMTLNALAAAAVGYAVGLSIREIANALENFSPIKGRMNIHLIDDDRHLIDDTYNANPGSVKAALNTLNELKKEHRSLAALGDMLELGDASRDLHREIGSAAARTGISKLYVTGNFAQAVAQGAQAGGMADEDILVGTKEEIFNALIKQFKPGDWLLVKGSRGMRMETLVEEILEALGKGPS